MEKTKAVKIPEVAKDGEEKKLAEELLYFDIVLYNTTIWNAYYSTYVKSIHG